MEFSGDDLLVVRSLLLDAIYNLGKEGKINNCEYVNLEKRISQNLGCEIQADKVYHLGKMIFNVRNRKDK